MSAIILVSPRVRSTFPGALFAALILLAPARATAQVIYTITDLGSLGGNTGQVYGINAAGQSTGRFVPPSSPTSLHAFRSTSNGQPPSLTDLGTFPGGSFSYGRGINDAGQVTGLSSASVGPSHAFRTTPAGTISDPGTDLGALVTPGNSLGYGINASGQVAGHSDFTGSTAHAFRSSPNGQPVVLTDLGAFPYSAGLSSVGQAINASGQVAGYAEYAPGFPGQTGPTRAFRTTATGLVSDPGADLGTLGGSQSQAFGINDSGQVVGQSFTAFDVARHAFRSTPNGSAVVLTDLGTLGGTISEALAINSLGVVVGDSTIIPGLFVTRAFIYDTQMRDLNSLIDPNSGWVLGSANGINDAGQIAGIGTFEGAPHVYRLTPVPEPGGMMLAGMAAAALLWLHLKGGVSP